MQAQTLAPVTRAQFAEKPSAMKQHDGVAALYDVEIDRGFFMLEIAPKAFAKSIGDPGKILILNQHSAAQPIGRAARFKDGKEALEMDFLLNTEIQAGAEVDSNIRHGVLTGLSVGFDIKKIELEKRGGEGAKGYEVERIIEAELKEVSCVSFPAIDGARINASDVAKDTVTTFVVNNGEPRKERLREGDRITLATYAAVTPARVRPNPPQEEELSDDVDSPPQEDSPDVDSAPAPQEELSDDAPDAVPQKVELTEDQKYPGAREALERMLGMKTA